MTILYQSNDYRRAPQKRTYFIGNIPTIRPSPLLYSKFKNSRVPLQWEFPSIGVSREARKSKKLRKALVVFTVSETILKNTRINSRLKIAERNYFPQGRNIFLRVVS